MPQCCQEASPEKTILCLCKAFEWLGQQLAGWLARKIFDKALEAAKRKYVNPWNSFVARNLSVWAIDGISALSIAAVPSLILTFGLHQPFDTLPDLSGGLNSTTFTLLLTIILIRPIGSRVHNHLKRMIDLEAPWFYCQTERCINSHWGILGHDLTNAILPYRCDKCHGLLGSRMSKKAIRI